MATQAMVAIWQCWNAGMLECQNAGMREQRRDFDFDRIYIIAGLDDL